jgi:hypothetical protein
MTMIQNEKIVALNPSRSAPPAAVRNEQSFWAVWKLGSEWPTMFLTKAAAEADARSKARLNPGETVWLMKVDPRGTIKYPHGPIVTGELSEAPPEPRAVKSLPPVMEPVAPVERVTFREPPAAPTPAPAVKPAPAPVVVSAPAPREPVAARPLVTHREPAAAKSPPAKESALGLWWPDNRG